MIKIHNCHKHFENKSDCSLIPNWSKLSASAAESDLTFNDKIYYIFTENENNSKKKNYFSKETYYYH